MGTNIRTRFCCMVSLLCVETFSGFPPVEPQLETVRILQRAVRLRDFLVSGSLPKRCLDKFRSPMIDEQIHQFGETVDIVMSIM